MGGMILWKDKEISRLRSDMERLCASVFEDFGVSPFPRVIPESPSIDLCDTDENLIVKVELPGVDPDDLDITITDDLLTVKGEVKREAVESSASYHATERRYGFFSRAFKLPCRVKTENVEASYRKGVLSITLPKCEAQSPRKIDVKTK